MTAITFTNARLADPATETLTERTAMTVIDCLIAGHIAEAPAGARIADLGTVRGVGEGLIAGNILPRKKHENGYQPRL